MSLDQHLQPIESFTPPASPRDRADAVYRQLFGWTVQWRAGHPFLSLENGICAAMLPKMSAAPVLARLAAIGCPGPAVVTPTPHGQRVAVLAETDGLISNLANRVQPFPRYDLRDPARRNERGAVAEPASGPGSQPSVARV